MFIYNITSKVQHNVLASWMNWQYEIHIPEIMATQCFCQHKMYELLEQDEEEGKTFVVQFFFNTTSDYQKYLSEFAPALRNKSIGKWGDSVFSFRSVLQEIK